MAVTTSKSIFSRFFGTQDRLENLEAEKVRLQAFLSAFPGEYCGLAPDGSTVYSAGFCSTLGLEQITTIHDIQNTLSPSDAAALEGMLDRLSESGTPFTLHANSLDESKSFEISGAKGQDPDAIDQFLVLWIEDITQQIEAQSHIAEKKQEIESEFQQVRTALDSIPRPVWLRDGNQNLVWVNNTYSTYLDKELSGILTEQIEITNKPAKKTQSDPQIEPGKTLAEAALKNGSVAETRAHGIFHGKRLLLKISEIPLGSLGMTLGIAYNISREEELENELSRFQSSTNELLEQVRSAIAIFDSNQKLEFYNTAFSQTWDLEAGWLNRKPKLGEIMEKLRENRRLPEQADFRSFKQSWLDMFTNLINPDENMLYLPDGAALRMLTIPHSMGGLIMIFEDVSSRLELESSYNTLIAVQRETLDNLAEGVAVFGSDGRLKLWNPTFANMWDLNPEDLDGEPHVNRLIEKKKTFFHETEWPIRKTELIAKVLERTGSQSRLSCKKDHDTNTLIDVITVPLPDGGIMLTYIDVTSNVEIENALRDKAQALETAEQLKLDFLANVSYKLRTPLNAIMGFADILKNEYFGELNDRQKNYTADIQDASETLLELINDILDLSTLEAGYLSLDRSDFKIKTMLDHVYELVSDWGRKEKVEITLKCPTNIGNLNADQRRIQQAIINVIRNAIEFTQEGGTIAIGASRKKEAIHFVIQDSGVGISGDDKMRIFKPFERAQAGSQSRSNKSPGAGVGLSLVHSIVDAHGGNVQLNSEEGKGTEIVLIIPLTSTKTDLKIPAKKSRKVPPYE